MSLDAGDVNAIWYTKNLPSASPTETPATALLQAQQKAISAATDAAAAAAQSKANGGTLSSLSTRVDGLDAKLNAVLLAIQNINTGGGTSVTDADAAKIAEASADELEQRLQS